MPWHTKFNNPSLVLFSYALSFFSPNENSIPAHQHTPFTICNSTHSLFPHMPFTTVYTIPETQVSLPGITPYPSSTHISPYFIAVRSSRSLSHSTSTAPIIADPCSTNPIHRHTIRLLSTHDTRFYPFCASIAVSDVRSLQYRSITVPFLISVPFPSTATTFPSTHCF